MDNLSLSVDPRNLEIILKLFTGVNKDFWVVMLHFLSTFKFLF